MLVASWPARVAMIEQHWACKPSSVFRCAGRTSGMPAQDGRGGRVPMHAERTWQGRTDSTPSPLPWRVLMPAWSQEFTGALQAHTQLALSSPHLAPLAARIGRTSCPTSVCSVTRAHLQRGSSDRGPPASVATLTQVRKPLGGALSACAGMPGAHAHLARRLGDAGLGGLRRRCLPLPPHLCCDCEAPHLTSCFPPASAASTQAGPPAALAAQ